MNVKLHQVPEPTMAWLDEFKQQDIDSMLIDLTLLGEDDFCRAVAEHLYGPIPIGEDSG